MPTFSNLYCLKAELRIQPVNTGRLIFPTGRSGIVTNDMEGLHAVQYENGTIGIQAGIELSGFAYRGQTEEYPKCVPGPWRGDIENNEVMLMALCRAIAFEDAISSHPLVRLAESKSLYVDKEGLAQHYGFVSDMLDLTSNFDVASFFATCFLDGHKYMPMNSASKPGVIYQMMPFVVTSHPDCGEDMFRIVGWQPLPRPEQQRAFAIRLKSGQDLRSIPTVQCHTFWHDAEVSNHIWESFDRGDALFPADAAYELSQKALNLDKFTRRQIDIAWSRLEAWTKRQIATKAAIEISAGITVSEHELLGWTGLIPDCDAPSWHDQLSLVMDKVNCRRTMYL